MNTYESVKYAFETSDIVLARRGYKYYTEDDVDYFAYCDTPVMSALDQWYMDGIAVDVAKLSDTFMELHFRPVEQKE